MNLFQKFKKSFTRHPEEDKVKSFREIQQQEQAYDNRKVGIRTIPLGKIVGSVGRYHDFDSRFHLKVNLPAERFLHIREAMQRGKQMPPVQLYQIRDEYYVMDGNHRVAAAKNLDHSDIMAHIVEFLPSKNSLQNILYREKIDFADTTGLSDPIELTEVGQYAHLLKQIGEHQAFLKTNGTEPVDFQAAALDWQKTIYQPLVTIIQNSRLPAAFPRRTVDDLYLYISFHQWERGRERKYGIGVDDLIPRNMEEFRLRMAKMTKSEFPDMERNVTALVMINVKTGKDEYRIMDKLFAREEVREIYSVPGDIDIITKIVLTRSLLASDSEIVGQFVYDFIRQIPGVTRTQTIIPYFSKAKAASENGE